MPAELADNATHEEIEAFATEAAREIEEARRGEVGDDKSDSHRIAEGNDQPTTERTTAETGSGSNDTAGGKAAGEASQAAGQAEWLDDTLRAEIAAYGIDEKELEGFSSREEFDRALRLLERGALDAGRKAMVEGEEAKTTTQERDSAGRFLPKGEGEEEAPKPATKEGQYSVDLDPELYDDGLIAEFGKLRDHYESRLGALEARLADADAREEEVRFDAAVDALGHSELFGKTGSESPEELERRENLLVATKAQQIGLRQMGRKVGEYPSLVGRVARMVFAEELGKQDLKARTRKVFDQANGRMGGSGARATGPGETLEEEYERIYREMEAGGGSR